MTRPFRTEPPRPPVGGLLRPRLLALLARRWEQRVVVVRGAAGLGKTTLLTHAVRENRLAPRGIDVWLTADDADGDAATLVDGLAVSLTAAGLPVAGGDLDAVVAAVVLAAPSAVCLVVDDVHRIPTGSSGAAVLDQLIDVLPGHASLVLAGRGEPPVALARLTAQRRVARVDEDDLVFTADELEAISRDGALAATGGWPALAALSSMGRKADVRAFITEEVLAGLDAERRDLLFALVAVGRLGPALARHLLGRPVDLAAELSGVPLLHTGDDGTVVPHQLWIDADLVPPDRGVALRAAAAEWHEQAGDDEAALDLLDPGSPAAAAVLRRLAISVAPAPTAVVRRWLDRLPAAVADTPAALLLRAVVLRAEDPGSTALVDLLERVVGAARVAGDGELETAALAHQGFVANLRRDPGRLAAVLARVAELAAAGCAPALPLAALGRAAMANARQDSDAVLAELERVDAGALPGSLGAVAEFLRSNALLDQGDPAAVDAARRCRATGPPLPGMADIEFRARFLAGDLDDLLDAQVPGTAGDADPRDQLIACVVGAGAAAMAGRHARAAELAARARRLAGDEGGVDQTRFNLLLVDALTAFHRGDDTATGSALAELIAAFPLDGAYRSRFRPLLVPLYLTAPARRAEVAALVTGPIWRDHLTVARLLAGEVGPGEVDWPAPGIILTAAGVTGAVRLITDAWSVRPAEARSLLDWLHERLPDETTDALRRLASPPAATILGTVPVRPRATRHLLVLGPTELIIGRERVDNADWRRERVRSLLAFLVVHPTTTRDAVMAALWPDADPESARGSLRSTLNRLLKVLEPERRAGDAAWFVRTEGSRLRLVTGEHLRVDVEEFERHLAAARAAEDAGAPTLVIEESLAAVALWRGDHLADVAAEEWAQGERQRIRSAFCMAGTRAAELLVADRRIDEALKTAGLVVDAEPYADGAYRAMVAAYRAAGDAASAHRTEARLTEVMAELGLDP